MAIIENNSFLYVIDEKKLFELFHCAIYTTMKKIEWEKFKLNKNHIYRSSRKVRIGHICKIVDCPEKGECGCWGMILQLLSFHLEFPA